MPRFEGRWCLALALVSGFVAALWLLHHPRRSAQPLDDWDIPHVITHLEQKGLQLRTVPAKKDGPLSQGIYLTTTQREWEYFNHLFKDPQHIERWQGTVYCERSTGRQSIDLDTIYGDCYLIAGPFFFFGDRDLLEKVRTALGVHPEQAAS